jgi:hypothetical protein
MRKEAKEIRCIRCKSREKMEYQNSQDEYRNMK